MIYCTLEDLRTALPEKRLIEATDDSLPSADGSVQEPVADAAMRSASVLIDAHLGTRYALPLPMVPDVLRRICVNLAVHDLYARVRTMELPEAIKDRYKEAIRLLESVRDGKIGLGLPAATASGASPAAGVTVITGRKLFPRHRLERGLDSRFRGAW